MNARHLTEEESEKIKNIWEDVTANHINNLNNEDKAAMAKAVFNNFTRLSDLAKPLTIEDEFEECKQSKKLYTLSQLPKQFVRSQTLEDIVWDSVSLCEISSNLYVVLENKDFDIKDKDHLILKDSLGREWTVEARYDDDGKLKGIFASNGKEEGEVYTRYEKERERELVKERIREGNEPDRPDFIETKTKDHSPFPKPGNIPPEIVEYIDNWIIDQIEHDPRFRDLDFAKLVREEALKLRRPLTEEEIDMMYKAYSNEKQRERSKGLGTRFDYEQEEDCDYEQEEEEDDYEMER